MIDVPQTVTYINFKSLQWAGHIVWMGSTGTQKKVMNGKFYGRPVGRPRLRWTENQETLIVAAEYKRMEEVSRGQEHLEANY